ncbi:hypothetical protein BD779DRAFT_263177 [Infundibulicybe gibba]|nr:hypothetical protein BD779DRAFT_263177 [Infundibulicybe gibba]
MLPSSFSEAWGGITICILLAGVLNGCIAMQAHTYFSKFKTDPPMMKYTVAAICLASTLHFACETWEMHSIIITGYFQPFFNVTIPIGLSITVVLQVFIRCSVQGVYIYRMHKFNRRMWILVPCCVVEALELGLGLTIAVRLAHRASAVQMYVWSLQLSWIWTLFLAISAALDVGITLSICIQLWQGREDGLKRTKYLVDTVIRWTVQTAFVTSAVAVTMMVAWNRQHNLLWVGLCALESDCYVCCLLAYSTRGRSCKHRDGTMPQVRSEPARNGNGQGGRRRAVCIYGGRHATAWGTGKLLGTHIGSPVGDSAVLLFSSPTCTRAFSPIIISI